MKAVFGGLGVHWKGAGCRTEEGFSRSIIDV